MPHKRSNNKMFREFSRLNQRYVKRNYLKNLRNTIDEFCEQHEIFEKELMFMLWCYDLEFWTLKYAAQDFKVSTKHVGGRYVYPLMKEGYVYKYFDKLTPSNTREDHLFRDELKYNYRVRYSLSQKGRLLVQRFYRELED